MRWQGSGKEAGVAVGVGVAVGGFPFFTRWKRCHANERLGQSSRLHSHAAKWRREADGGFNGQTECTSPRGFKDATRHPLMAFCSGACQTWIRLQNTVFQPPCLCQVSELKRLKWTAAVLFPSLLEAPIDGLWAPANEETQLLSKRRAPPTTSQVRVYT